MTDKASNIHTAINAVMQAVGYVQKQRSGGLNYTFASEAALIEAVRPAMVENGIYCSVAAVKDVVRGTYSTAKGTVMQQVDLTAVVRFAHGPSGTFIDVEALGSGADTGDKASNKALTGAYKYALRQTFCIATGDDPDQTPSRARADVNADTGEIKTNGHEKPALLSAEQAKAAVVAAGLTVDDFKAILPERNGKRVYSPERDSQKVRDLIRQNTPATEEAL